MRRVKRRSARILAALLLALIVTVTACQPQPAVVNIGYVNWAEGVAMTYLMEGMLEKYVNVKAELTQADAAPIFAGVANGDLDFFLEMWLPVTHATYWDEYKDRLDNYGTVYEGARIGLVVPDYVPIGSIEELNENAEQLGGEIVGIDAGAGIMQASDEAIGAYDLDLSLTTSSGPAMTAALGRAIENEEWVVVTGWTPHWMFSEWDLKFLDDPKGVYGEAEDIYTIARQGFEDDHHDVADMLKKFYLTDAQIGDLMTYMDEGPDERAAAERWINDNTELVQSWLP